MNTLRSRKFMAVLSLGAIGSLIAVTAHAQTAATPKPAAGSTTAPATETVTMEKFVTTGSRLTGASAQADVPISIIGKADIDATPKIELADYLRDFPAFTGAGNTNDSSTNGGGGARNIDLRGLGSQYTLVLLNGRRLAYAGGTGNVVDVNQIPVTAIDHVEVLTQGASAVYGTDAIGGVVNVITKHGQNGGEIYGYFGDTNFKNNGNRNHVTTDGRRQFAFSLNGSEGKVDFMVGAQYYKQNGMYSSDYAWSNSPGPTSNTFPYRLSLPNSIFTAGATGNSFYVVKWRPGEGGPKDAKSAADFRLYDGRLMNLANLDAGGDQFPFFLYTPLLRPEERYNAFAFTTYKLTDDIKVNVDVMYRYAYSYNQLAPAAVPVPSGGAIVIPATNYWNQQIFGAKAVAITSGNWRMLGLGPRLDTAELNGVWANAGIEGKISGDWHWKVEGLFTQETTQFLQGNSGAVAVLNGFLARTDPTAFNPFTSDPKTNQAAWNTIRSNAYTNDRSRITSMDATVDGKIADLPAGQMKGALTVDWNKLRAYDHPDALVKATPLGFNGTPNDTDGSRTQWGVSAEADVPITSQFSGRVAGRHDNYSDFGGVNVGQAALRFQPTKELLFRGSFGQGFLAPSLLQLHEGSQINNPTFLDPTAKNSATSWGANTQVNITRIGNPNLKAEKANMWNVGLAYSPKEIKGLTVSVDYWNTTLKNEVSAAEDFARVIAQKFWQSLGSTDAARDAAARNPATRATAVASILASTGATVTYDPAGGPAGLGGLSTTDTAIANVGRANLAGTKTDGIDFSVNYPVSIEQYGTVILDLKGTYTHKFDKQALVGEPFDNLAGMYSSSFEGAWPKWKTSAVVSWMRKDWGANVTYHHFGSVKLEDGVDPTFGNDHLASYDTVDLQLSYRVPWTKTNISVGLENAGNRRPPLTSFATNNFVGGGTYDVKGRFYYIRLSQKF